MKVIQKDKEFLQKGLSKDSEYAYMSADSVMEKIKSMPIAYDADKVVERLEVNSMFAQADDEPFVILDDAVEIVKSGGIE